MSLKRICICLCEAHKVPKVVYIRTPKPCKGRPEVINSQETLFTHCVRRPSQRFCFVISFCWLFFSHPSFHGSTWRLQLPVSLGFPLVLHLVGLKALSSCGCWTLSILVTWSRKCHWTSVASMSPSSLGFQFPVFGSWDFLAFLQALLIVTYYLVF